MKPLNRLIASALILVFLLPSQLCHAWSEGGHHLIAAVAFSLLTEKEQAELISVLQKHPRYAEDFVPPDELRLLEKTRRLSPVFLQFFRTYASLAPWRETTLCGPGWSRGS
ncbi:MAG: hypothetical protein ACOYKN_16920 [Pirellula sp.]